MAEFDAGGARIWYDVHGEGTDYLLQIGGAGFAHENFGFVTHLMTPHFKVIEFDLRGYGLSERPEQEYSMEIWADDIKALFDHIGVAARARARHVDGRHGRARVRRPLPRPRRRPRCSTAPRRSRTSWRASHWEVWKKLAQAYGMGSEPLALEIATKCLSRTFLDTPAGPGDRQGDPGGARAELRRAGVRRRLRRDGEHGPAAVLRRGSRRRRSSMAGSEDCLTPIDAGPDGAGSRWIAEQIPGAALDVIEGSGHTNLMEEPELSAQMVIEFLQSVAATRS